MKFSGFMGDAMLVSLMYCGNFCSTCKKWCFKLYCNVPAGYDMLSHRHADSRPSYVHTTAPLVILHRGPQKRSQVIFVCNFVKINGF